MRKFTLSLSRFVALLAVLLMGVGTGLAQTKDNPLDLGELQINHTYTDLKWGGYYTGWFVSPIKGTMYTCAGIEIGKDAEFTQIVPDKWEGYGEKAYSFELEANTTYYLRCADWTGLQQSQFTLYMEGVGDVQLELVNCDPAQGSAYSSANNNPIILEFSSPMDVSAVKSEIVAPDGTKVNTGIGVTAYGNYLNFAPATVIDRLVNQGHLKKGDKFSLNLTNVKSATGSLYKGTGELSLEFVSAGENVVLVSETVPDEFLSYYAPDSPAGIFTMTFSAPLSTTELPSAYLAFGNIDNDADGGYYHEVVPCTVEGNVITINVTGKSRRVAEMIGANAPSEAIVLHVSNVRDADGNFVASPGDGTVGSYTFGMKYTELQRVNILAEFTPFNGTSLNGVNELSIWVNGVNQIDFSGVKFEYVDANGETKSVIVPRAEVSYTAVEDDPTQGTFKVTIPEAVKGQKNVKVTFADLTVNDGYDHQYDIMAEYDGLVILNANPANGTEVTAINTGDVLTVDFNYADTYPNMYVEYEIHDLNAVNPDYEIIKAYTYMIRQENGSYTSEFFQDYNLVRGHAYSVLFTAWESEDLMHQGSAPLGTTTLTWYGLTEPFKASDTKLVGLTPDPATAQLTTADNEITIEFDGLVSIAPADAQILTGSGTSIDFASVEPVGDTDNTEDNRVVATTWKLTIPQSYLNSLNSQLLFSVKVYDVEGLLVVPADEEYPSEESYFTFTYDVAARYADFDVTPGEESEISSLKEIIVSNTAGINESFLVAPSQIIVSEMRGGEVAHVETIEAPEIELGQVRTSLKLILDKEITTPGNYIIDFPAGVFVIGEEYEAKSSAAKTVRILIKEPAAPLSYTTDPKEGNVESLSKVTMTFENVGTDGINRSWSGIATITLPSGDVVELKNDADVEVTSVDPSNWDIPFNMVVITLPETYTGAGNYTITLPAGYLNIGSGTNEADIVLHYTIGQSGISSVIAPADGVYEVYNLQGVQVGVFESADELSQLPAGLYIINGVKYLVR